MKTVFYDDDPISVERPRDEASIFLAGPTLRSGYTIRTPWRKQAISLLSSESVVAIVPEFRDAIFALRADERFGPDPGQSMRVVEWEIANIERATVVAFWMPFFEGMPGLTTRSEVVHELALRSYRVVLGMPPEAMSSSHIRYRAMRENVRIHETLRDTIAAAVRAAKNLSDDYEGF